MKWRLGLYSGLRAADSGVYAPQTDTEPHTATQFRCNYLQKHIFWFHVSLVEWKGLGGNLRLLTTRHLAALAAATAMRNQDGIVHSSKPTSLPHGKKPNNVE